MREKLENYRNLLREYNTLKEEYSTLQAKPTEMLADTVHDYRTGFPRTIMISGYGSRSYVEKRERLAARLNESLTNLHKEREEVEDLITRIDDSEVRNIIRLHYVKGMTYDDIAYELNTTKKTLFNKINKFL